MQCSLRRSGMLNLEAASGLAADVSTRRTSSLLRDMRAALKPWIALHGSVSTVSLVKSSCHWPLKSSTQAMCLSRICTNLLRHVLNLSHFLLAFGFLVARNGAIPFSSVDIVQSASSPTASSPAIQAMTNRYFLR